MSSSVVWTEAPDDGRDDEPEAEAHGSVDETFAARRLRRWLKGMFGGEPPAAELEDQPGRKPEA